MANVCAVPRGDGDKGFVPSEGSGCPAASRTGWRDFGHLRMRDEREGVKIYREKSEKHPPPSQSRVQASPCVALRCWEQSRGHREPPGWAQSPGLGWHLCVPTLEPLPSVTQHPLALSSHRSCVVPGGTATQPGFWGFFWGSVHPTALGEQQLLAQGQPGINQGSRRDGKGQWRQGILQRDGSELFHQLQEGGKSQSKL